MIFWFNILYLIILPFYAVSLFVKGKWHAGMSFRFGIWNSGNELQSFDSSIWIHAVSVGEVSTVVDFIHRLKEKYPNDSVILSVVTPTGFDVAKKSLSSDISVIFAPVDFSWVVKNFIRRIQPKLYIAAETEIWPNLYLLLNQNDVPVMQVNGRISDRSFEGYQKWKGMLDRILNCVSFFCMQSELDAERIEILGASKDRISVTGNMKFDAVSVDQQPATSNQQLQYFIAGSTHPGEEEIVLSAYQSLRKDFSDLRLILVPRHIERVKDVVDLVGQEQFTPVLFSDWNQGGFDQEHIVIVDQIGHLKNFYRKASVVFVGKTFRVGGGQNMIEPLAFGKPTVVGPLTQNFRDVVDLFLRENVLVQIDDENELAAAVRDLLENNNKRDFIYKTAIDVIQKHQGATEKCLKKVEEVLSS